MKLKTIKGLSVKKQERLNDIFLKMCRSEVRVRDLAKLYNTTERTIQNDIKELSKIYNITSPSRGIYKLNMDFQIEEKFEEVFSKFIIKANYDIFYQFKKLIEKIEFKTTYNSTEMFEINFKVEKLKDSGILIDLIQAIEWNFAVEFDYKTKKRLIQPLKILNYNTVWYLIGFDVKDNKIKTFKINRIKNLILKTESFIDESFKQKVKSISTPWIDKEKKESVCRVYYPFKENVTENIIHKEKEFVDVKIEFYDEREAFEIIKKYLPFVKVLDEELREKVKKFLENSIEMI